MSCRDYLKNKLSGIQKVVNVRNPTDASMITQKKRYAATTVFDFEVIPPDASFYTAYRGAQGISNDLPYRVGGRKSIPCNPNVNSSSWSYPSASDRGRTIKICEQIAGVHQGYPLYAGEPARKLAGGYNDNSNLIVDPECEYPGRAPVFRATKNLIAVYLPTSSHTTKDFFMKAPPLFRPSGVDSVKVGQWVASKSVSFPYVESHHGNPNLAHEFAYRGRRGVPRIYGNWVVAKINRATLFNIKSTQQINAVYW